MPPSVVARRRPPARDESAAAPRRLRRLHLSRPRREGQSSVMPAEGRARAVQERSARDAVGPRASSRPEPCGCGAGSRGPPPAPVVAPAPKPEPPAAPVGPFFELRDVNETPRVATRVEPQVPDELRDRQLNEVVIVRVLVTQAGHPLMVNLLRQSKAGPSLDDAIVAAVKQWTFVPARKRGEPVSCWYHVGVPVSRANTDQAARGTLRYHRFRLTSPRKDRSSMSQRLLSVLHLRVSRRRSRSAPLPTRRRQDAARNGRRRGPRLRTVHILPEILRPSPTSRPRSKPQPSGAVDQTFRLIVKPDLWGKTARLRLTNVFGTRPVTFDDVFVGLQSSGGNVAAGTNRQVRFERGRTSVTIPAGASAASDAIELTFVTSRGRPAADRAEARRQLSRRRIDRADDVARQGAHDVVSHGASLRQPRPRGKRRRVSVHDHVLVLPRCRRCRRRRGDGRRRVLRRFDYRRHGVDAQRRRSLARRPLAPAAREVRCARFGGQRRHRRQSRRVAGRRIRSRGQWRAVLRPSSGSIATWRDCLVCRR